jgi:capsular exopolysaccharide synthesis family protein
MERKTESGEVVRLTPREPAAHARAAPVPVDRLSEALDRAERRAESAPVEPRAAIPPRASAPRTAPDPASRPAPDPAPRPAPDPASRPAPDHLTRVMESALGDERAAGPGPVASPVLAPAGSVRYTRTRVVRVGEDTLRANRIVLGDGEVATAYKLLRTRVLAAMRSRGWRTLAVTSPGPGEGKTVVATNLAAHVALDVGVNALLVDANLRSPAVAQRFGLARGLGLPELLSGEARIEEVLVHPGIGRLVLLPGSASLSNAAEALGSPAMGALARELATRYDDRVVIFDLPALASTADAAAFLPHVDCVLLVVAERETGRDALERATGLLAGSNLVGVTLNKSDERMRAPAPPRRRWLARLGM